MIKFKEEFQHLYPLREARIVDIRTATPRDWGKLKNYWWDKYKIEIDFFAEVYKVRFAGTKTAYDFPSSVFQKDDNGEPQ